MKIKSLALARQAAENGSAEMREAIIMCNEDLGTGPRQNVVGWRDAFESLKQIAMSVEAECGNGEESVLEELETWLTAAKERTKAIG